MSGTIRPSSTMCAFHSVNEPSSSPGSCPRSASRTGCAESGVTRYWYQEISQATVIDDSALTPESGTIETLRRAEALRDPADRAPELRGVEVVGRLDDRELRLGEPAQDRLARDRRLGRARATPSSAASEKRLRRRRSAAIVGVVGEPSLIQPYSTRGLLAERADVDVRRSPPFGENRIGALAHQERALADRALRDRC